MSGCCGRRFYVGAALTVPVMAIAMGPMVAPHLLHGADARALAWAQLALTTPVFFWSGAFFIRRWWASLRERDTNMFTLTVTGTGAAYVYSVLAVLFGGSFPAAFGRPRRPLYFEATAFITTVVLLGRSWSSAPMRGQTRHQGPSRPCPEGRAPARHRRHRE